jgi:hypothetical protein
LRRDGYGIGRKKTSLKKPIQIFGNGTFLCIKNLNQNSSGSKGTQDILKMNDAINSLFKQLVPTRLPLTIGMNEIKIVLTEQREFYYRAFLK